MNSLLLSFRTAACSKPSACCMRQWCVVWGGLWRRLQLCLCCLWFMALPVAAHQDACLDSLFAFAQRAGDKQQHISASIYLRHRMHTQRRGQVVRYLPHMFPLEKGKNDYLSEATLKVDVHPNGRTDCRIEAYYSSNPHISVRRFEQSDGWVFLLYGPHLFHPHLLNPLHPRNRRFYYYNFAYAAPMQGYEVLRYHIVPRFSNSQLVRGEIDLDRHTGQVRNFSFTYRYNLQNVTVTGRPGSRGLEALLPQQARVMSKFRLMGNKVDEVYEMQAQLSDMPADTLLTSPSARSAHSLDLTSRYSVVVDTSGMRYGLAPFDSLRPFPLRAAEATIYSRAESLRQEFARRYVPKQRTQQRSFEQTQRRKYEVLLNSFHIPLGSHRESYLRLPPVFTPSMVQWSGSKGLSLQTRIRMNYHFAAHDATLSFVPRVGYSFKQKQVHWSLPLALTFWPSTDASLEVRAAGGAHVYNSRQAREVAKLLEQHTHYDSLLQVLRSFNLAYYRDNRVEGDFNLSPAPGLRLKVGGRYHRRVLMNAPRWEGEQSLQRVLESVGPRLEIAYTPRQYYCLQGKRRVPLYSHFPTFTLAYERGYNLKHGSNHYERVEGDIYYHLRLYALRSLYFCFGGGTYTHCGLNTFLDYDFFRFNNMPSDWTDELTGSFQLLDSRWYNESRYYVRATSSYESPMLLFARVPRLSRFVTIERLYLNLLSVRSLGLYSEIGYGIGTPLLDLGFFTSVAPGHRLDFGFRCIFKLFDD